MKSRKLGKTGDSLELLGLEGRNHGITLKKNEKKRNLAKKSHSYIPGQCKHQHVEEMRSSPLRGDPEKLCAHAEISSEDTTKHDSGIATPKFN